MRCLLGLVGVLFIMGCQMNESTSQPASAPQSPTEAGRSSLEELLATISHPVDSKVVTDLEQKYDLHKSYKFDEGSLTAPDQSFVLMYRDNKVENVILNIGQWPEGYGDDNWKVYSGKVPGDLVTTDDPQAVAKKLGEPTTAGGDRWTHGSHVLWVHFDDRAEGVESVWVSNAK